MARCLIAGSFSITWAKDQPEEDLYCAVLRKGGRDSKPELVAADCDMQARYLCTLQNDIACGVRDTCYRSSVAHRTWTRARKECNVTELLGGSENQAYDLRNLAPGLYWVQLRRQSTWQWLSGETSTCIVVIQKCTLDPIYSDKILHHIHAGVIVSVERNQ